MVTPKDVFAFDDMGYYWGWSQTIAITYITCMGIDGGWMKKSITIL
jgi:hypothetical protein